MREKPSELGPTATRLDRGTGGLHERPGRLGSWPALLETSAQGLKAGTIEILIGDAPIGCSCPVPTPPVPPTSVARADATTNKDASDARATASTMRLTVAPAAAIFDSLFI
jgi:hypothetical protein